jgi:anti-sigma factor (TIGR02949 family)
MTHLSRYTCEEAFRRLDDYLDRELSAEETMLVKEHLEICAGCAREFNFETSLLNGVRAKLQQIELPPTLQARILGALAEPGRGTGD